MMSARSAARSCAGSRSASSSVWTFARRLAIGVRSSWLASATIWRCDSTACSSASSVVLKLCASRASSSRPTTSIRWVMSGAPAIASVRRVKRATGSSAARATSAPSSAASAIPRGADQHQREQDVVEHVVDLGERAGDLDRPARARCPR